MGGAEGACETHPDLRRSLFWSILDFYILGPRLADTERRRRSSGGIRRELPGCFEMGHSPLDLLDLWARRVAKRCMPLLSVGLRTEGNQEYIPVQHNLETAEKAAILVS